VPAPFVGALVSVAVLGEHFGARELSAAFMMLGGIGLLVYEEHAHAHTHEPLEHDHRHVHDEHHQHAHSKTENLWLNLTRTGTSTRRSSMRILTCRTSTTATTEATCPTQCLCRDAGRSGYETSRAGPPL
jgi:hypothetical protein